MIIVWTLRVDDVVTVHVSREAALAALRTNHADSDAPEDDAELVDWLCGIGFSVSIDRHEMRGER